MFENIMLSLRGIRSHKMRSALTMIGIIIGIASIIIIVSIIGGASAQLKEVLVGDSTNTVTLDFYKKEDDSYFSSSYDVLNQGAIPGIDKISDETLESVLNVDGVDKAARVYLAAYAEVKYLSNSSYLSGLYGVDTDFFPLSGYLLSSGRLITQRDIDMHNNVAVISDMVANKLFKNESALGKTIQVGNDLFTIVGIVTKPVDYSEVNNLSDYYLKVGFMDGVAYVPSTTWNSVICYDDIQRMVIMINDPDKIVSASTEAANVLNGSLSSSDYEYKSGTLSEDADYLKEITNIASILLIGIASISLIVGGIGVMNIMLVSVTERTREIGLKKALGAKRRVILGQFLTESVVLTSLGGIAGVLFGIGIAKLVGVIIDMPVVISPMAIAIAVGFSMGVGIIFGLVPSVKAANLNPIDALRYE